MLIVARQGANQHPHHRHPVSRCGVSHTLNKKGNSNTQERIALMKRVCVSQHIPKAKIRILVADQEFIGQE